MKRTIYLVTLPLALCLAACDDFSHEFDQLESENLTMSDVARIFSELPIGPGHIDEVYDAVCSSAGNGYDEEYTMADLFSNPGAGVGDTKAAKVYDSPLRDLLTDYFRDKGRTKAGSADVQAYIDAIVDKEMQIYWPYSEDWDGTTAPVITFDPGFGAESNYGYEVAMDEDGNRVVNRIIVDESVAMSRPVWVINTNDDRAFTPLDFFMPEEQAMATGDGSDRKTLRIKSFKALRSYDSWFGGASEFLVKCGAVNGFKASTDDDLKLYTPSVTDFMVVIRRKQVGLKIPLNAILLTDFTPQMDKLAFIILEDDGGTITNWKSEATVKYKSKSYGYEINIPYNDKDDIVWRGQLSATYFDEKKPVEGRFGDVVITFELL